MVSCGIADQKGIGGTDKLLRGGNRVRGGAPDLVQQRLCKHGVDQLGKVRNGKTSKVLTGDIAEIGIASANAFCRLVHFFHSRSRASENTAGQRIGGILLVEQKHSIQMILHGQSVQNFIPEAGITPGAGGTHIDNGIFRVRNRLYCGNGQRQSAPVACIVRRIVSAPGIENLAAVHIEDNGIGCVQEFFIGAIPVQGPFFDTAEYFITGEAENSLVPGPVGIVQINALLPAADNKNSSVIAGEPTACVDLLQSGDIAAVF